jgi:hypothetical protein
VAVWNYGGGAAAASGNHTLSVNKSKYSEKRKKEKDTRGSFF